jgi:hypothetical protein
MPEKNQRDQREQTRDQNRDLAKIGRMLIYEAFNERPNKQNQKKLEEKSVSCSMFLRLSF